MVKMSVLVLAAGSGKRFGGIESKIFARLDNQPLFLRALQLFVNREDVAQTILVVSPRDLDQMKSKYGANLGFMGVQLVAGGDERFHSVANGLAAINDDAEYVAVHDAARVCVAAEWIDAIFAAAQKSGAAAPVIPVTSTLKRVGPDHLIGETVPRDGLYMSQTPQIFRRSILVKAYEWLKNRPADRPPVTDDAQLVTESGGAVTAVEGDARNIKITTRGDLVLAGAVLKALPQRPVSRRGAFEEAQW
ncbi:MAG: 2-C-methyl-D-erythritol 4-phosphate cytidylyltransferase [Phycisphaerae bacterium]|nr:MAG: 2-C-methyl-D-erythritol 4-phosphate cytidylyltransferase [Planctomycetia bacterium]RIK70497.1 MAG: 2-C-methyl-D-erythritol 4-phosphate cytidylyltransferase [Planctomycetota bacterium]GJQ26167.1 MAG: 2-C-methyl-D-erythritol 4-phosphate cytidylyltransferase [Phycisphaerae bacterium]